MCSQELASGNDRKSVESYSYCYTSFIQARLFSKFEITWTLETDNKTNISLKIIKDNVSTKSINYIRSYLNTLIKFFGY